MKFLIDFYKGLDPLNLIIFWGIIIVIILLLIFSFILINKNKKLKKIVENKIKQDDLPIKKIEPEELNVEKYQNYEKIQTNNEKEIVLPDIPKANKIEEQKTIETEKEFIAEEHIKKYNQDDFQLPIIKKNNEEETTNQNNYNNPQKNISSEIEIPTKPYQRNVLREMALSQTSPIGITRPTNKEDRIRELAKDLDESLNEKKERKEITSEKNMIVNETIKKELSKIDDSSNRKTEINYNNNRIERKTPTEKITPKQNETQYESLYNKSNQHGNTKPKEETHIKPVNTNYLQDYVSKKEEKTYRENNNNEKSYNTTNPINRETKGSYSYDKNEYIPPQVRELLNVPSIEKKENVSKSTSEKYLEEVSRKLAEAEIPDEIERTDYELEQEENAIISYKELMEKKDSIQTIDEEEAIISIEELMNRNNHPKELDQPEETKLYNITEEEANDNFLKELKQFRNDL